jgi:EAL domain-containing protein (putative c-di-GMP-specific phosphodiesterase class I)
MRIPLVIDDFGTGYSSLGYLRKLPVSAIKIDKSFVKNMAADDGDAVIVRSTIELAHNLGLLVVAEGVETQYIWDRLASLGCDAAQGYHMSAPIPAAALTRWFHESSWQVTKIADDVHPEAA